MIEHLRERILNGEVVPDKAIPALEADQTKNDTWMTKI